MTAWLGYASEFLTSSTFSDAYTRKAPKVGSRNDISPMRRSVTVKEVQNGLVPQLERRLAILGKNALLLGATGVTHHTY